MARDHSIKGVRYYDCDLCGFTYRYSDTTLNSAGLRVCLAHDVDEGEFRFSRLLSIQQTLKDVVTGKFYVLIEVNYYLVAIEVDDPGSKPGPYTIGDFGNGLLFQLEMYNGNLSVVEGRDGKRLLPLPDLCLMDNGKMYFELT